MPDASTSVDGLASTELLLRICEAVDEKQSDVALELIEALRPKIEHTESAMKTIAARIAAALEVRELAESVVRTGTLAIEQHSCDDSRQIAQTLDVASDRIWECRNHLHAAMALIPEGARPDDFELDEDATSEAPEL
jgi:hypothetical protein